jgi:tetratricopeptide (TPR) repeat protein
MWQLLGLFDRPAPADCLAELLKAPAIPHLTEELMGLSEAQHNIIFSRLEKANLLTVNRDATNTLVSLDTHPLIREYFAEKLHHEQLGDWQNAHRRIYKHLCKTKEGEQPTLEQLQPLFQAVAHGCAAGLHQEVAEDVYGIRIGRKSEFYLVRALGGCNEELTVLNCFFNLEWGGISELSDTTRAFILNCTGCALRALGQNYQAIELMQEALDLNIKLATASTCPKEAQTFWGGAAMNTNNISELCLTLGAIADAEYFGLYAMYYATQSGNIGMMVFSDSVYAEALHQAGKVKNALALYKPRKNYKPKHKYLCYMEGFRYCQLLLDQCKSKQVLKRAKHTLEIAQQSKWSLIIGLDQLTLGRAYLKQVEVKTLLKEVVRLDVLQCSERWLNQSVYVLRAAGEQSFFPFALLSRAAYYRHTQQFTLAHEDLAEVLDIAEPSGMRLHLTDFHLESARLALAEFPVDSAHPASGLATAESHIERAKKLIQDTGYNRRLPELDALQAQLKSVCP